MPLDPLISLEHDPDYAAKRGLKYGCGPLLPLDPVINMVLGHDLKSGKTMGLILEC